MSDQQPDPNKLPLEAYKLLVGQLQQEESLSWKRIEIFLVVNGGLIGILGLGRSSEDMARPLQGISLAICVMGFLMCFLWLIIAKRSEAFYNHWYEQLKLLEKSYLTPINIFQVADEYFDKGRITLGGKEFKLDRVSRLIKMYQAVRVVIRLFMVGWLALGVYLYFADP